VTSNADISGISMEWFKDLPPKSIDGIATLDDAFLRNWGNKKDLFYYIIEFGALKREEGDLFHTSQRDLIKFIKGLHSNLML